MLFVFLVSDAVVKNSPDIFSMAPPGIRRTNCDNKDEDVEISSPEFESFFFLIKRHNSNEHVNFAIDC